MTSNLRTVGTASHVISVVDGCVPRVPARGAVDRPIYWVPVESACSASVTDVVDAPHSP